jgi:hypothetical protein
MVTLRGLVEYVTHIELEFEPCRHGEMSPRFCRICKNEDKRERELVYYTAGGRHFHRNPACSALAEGQKIVADRGGTPAPLESSYLDILQTTRKPCRTCARNR